MQHKLHGQSCITLESWIGWNPKEDYPIPILSLSTEGKHTSLFKLKLYCCPGYKIPSAPPYILFCIRNGNCVPSLRSFPCSYFSLLQKWMLLQLGTLCKVRYMCLCSRVLIHGLSVNPWSGIGGYCAPPVNGLWCSLVLLEFWSTGLALLALYNNSYHYL